MCPPSSPLNLAEEGEEEAFTNNLTLGKLAYYSNNSVKKNGNYIDEEEVKSKYGGLFGCLASVQSRVTRCCETVPTEEPYGRAAGQGAAVNTPC